MSYTDTLRDAARADQLDAVHIGLLFSCEDLARLALVAVRVAAHSQVQLRRLADLVPGDRRGEAEAIVRACDERGEAIASEIEQVIGVEVPLLPELLEQ